MADAELHALPPLVRPERPIPVTVWIAQDNEWWPGFCTAWRGDRCSVEYTKGVGMRVLGWVPANDIRRVEGMLEELPAEPGTAHD